MGSLLRASLLPALALLAACATPVPAPVQSAAAPATARQQVAAIRAAAGNGDGELAVQPLRDAAVDDLREEARRLEAQGRPAEAGAVLDDAIAIVPNDPGLLQERAEIALLSGDPALAGALAERAQSLGAKVGPLCRRHWATIEQVRLVANDPAGAAVARSELAACTLAPPPRY